MDVGTAERPVRDPLAFSFDEEPTWRDHTDTTSQMVSEITTFRRKYEEDEVAKHFCKGFTKAMAVDYIYHLNIGEMVGTQTLEDTKAVLYSVMEERSGTALRQRSMTREERESVNTYQAMEKLHEMKNARILTNQQICDVHKVLMDGLLQDAGKCKLTLMIA